MLVLSRKEGEAVIIGDDVEVYIVSIDRGKVRIGIRAPQQVKIWRSELVKGSNAQTERLPTEEANHGP